jgi:hypothetical protein
MYLALRLRNYTWSSESKCCNYPANVHRIYMLSNTFMYAESHGKHPPPRPPSSIATNTLHPTSPIPMAPSSTQTNDSPPAYPPLPTLSDKWPPTRNTLRDSDRPVEPLKRETAQARPNSGIGRYVSVDLGEICRGLRGVSRGAARREEDG